MAATPPPAVLGARLAGRPSKHPGGLPAHGWASPAVSPGFFLACPCPAVRPPKRLREVPSRVVAADGQDVPAASGGPSCTRRDLSAPAGSLVISPSSQHQLPETPVIVDLTTLVDLCLVHIETVPCGRFRRLLGRFPPGVWNCPATHLGCAMIVRALASSVTPARG
jgi:hypothetical protein